VKLNLYDKEGIAGGIVSVRIFLGTGDQVPSASFQWSPRYKLNDSSSLDVGVIVTAQDLARTPLALLASRDARVAVR
jgi:hypothetical protein